MEAADASEMFEAMTQHIKDSFLLEEMSCVAMKWSDGDLVCCVRMGNTHTLLRVADGERTVNSIWLDSEMQSLIKQTNEVER